MDMKPARAIADSFLVNNDFQSYVYVVGGKSILLTVIFTRV